MVPNAFFHVSFVDGLLSREPSFVASGAHLVLEIGGVKVQAKNKSSRSLRWNQSFQIPLGLHTSHYIVSLMALGNVPVASREFDLAPVLKSGAKTCIVNHELMNEANEPIATVCAVISVKKLPERPQISEKTKEPTPKSVTRPSPLQMQTPPSREIIVSDSPSSSGASAHSNAARVFRGACKSSRAWRAGAAASFPTPIPYSLAAKLSPRRTINRSHTPPRIQPRLHLSPLSRMSVPEERPASHGRGSTDVEVNERAVPNHSPVKKLLLIGGGVVLICLGLLGLGRSKSHYKVKEGDTLSHISERYNVGMGRLLQANASLASDPDLLLVGETIRIPR